jgi:DNA-binding SARP family transcriptional activator
VRIVTLGGFRIERNGESIEWNRKAPRRPLEILKLMIAHRADALSAAMLMETLWPGEAGPQVRRRLDTALYRLRRILGDGAIRNVNGSIGLSAHDVEVDAFLFERDGDPALYTGAFLPDDLYLAWTVPMRESLKERLQAALAERAERLIADRRYADALLLCEQGISHHPTGESLYRLAIRICRLAGWRSDGARIYERCRECLGRELGLRPSRATEDEHLRLIRD